MKNIIVAIDFNEETEDILDLATDVAAGMEAAIHVAYIYPPQIEFPAFDPYIYPPLEDPEKHEEFLQDRKKEIREVVTKLKKKVTHTTGYMKPADKSVIKSIIEFSDEHDADMIIIGTHRPGRVERLVLGSTAEGVIRKAKIPVLVVPRSRGDED